MNKKQIIQMLANMNKGLLDKIVANIGDDNKIKTIENIKD